MFFTASDFTFTTRHIHNCISFPFWPSCFIFSGTIHICPPLFPNSILDTFWPGELILHCRIFLPFHTVHGLLKAMMLKWFTTPFPSGSHFAELYSMIHPSWVALHGIAHCFIELHKAMIHVMILISFKWLCFHSVYPLMDEDKSLLQAFWYEGQATE